MEIQLRLGLQPGTVEELAGVLECGWRAEENAPEGILYDRNHIGRGIHASISRNQVNLVLPFPAGIEEIPFLFGAAKELLKAYNGKSWTVDGLPYFFVSADALEQLAAEANRSAFETLADGEVVELDCALFPATVIAKDLELFSERLHKLQSSGVVYVMPQFFDMKKGTFGVFTFPEETPVIVYKDFSLYEKFHEGVVDGWKAMDDKKRLVDLDKYLKRAIKTPFDVSKDQYVFPAKKRWFLF